MVEHDPQIIKQADYIVEMGPLSGDQGGQVVCAAPYHTFLKHPTITYRAIFARASEPFPFPTKRRCGKRKGRCSLLECDEQNLKNLTVEYSPRHVESV